MRTGCGAGRRASLCTRRRSLSRGPISWRTRRSPRVLIFGSDKDIQDNISSICLLHMNAVVTLVADLESFDYCINRRMAPACATKYQYGCVLISAEKMLAIASCEEEQGRLALRSC